MKAASLALACALLGATALAPASFAQSPAGAPPSPAEASPSTAVPDRGDRFDGRSPSHDTRGRPDAYHDNEEDDEDDGTPATSGGGYGGARGMGALRAGAGQMDEMNPDRMRKHMHMRGGQPHGAQLKLQRGDAQIDIRCPGNENIAACVEAVGKLMDRLQSMPQTPR
jgi:hypothetical protein